MFALTTFSYQVSPEQLQEKLKKLRKTYPGPLIHKILVFGVPAEDALVRTDDIIPILSSKISPITSLGTTMCDITTDFLAELAISTRLLAKWGHSNHQSLKSLNNLYAHQIGSVYHSSLCIPIPAAAEVDSRLQLEVVFHQLAPALQKQAQYPLHLTIKMRRSNSGDVCLNF